MIADTPRPPAKPAIVVSAGYTNRPILGPVGCVITFAKLTPAAKRMGFDEIRTYWCAKQSWRAEV